MSRAKGLENSSKNKKNKRADGVKRAVRSKETARTCILVLGMHRSGTSMLSRILNIAGAALPSSLMGAGKGNEAGHWESNRLYRHHDALLKTMGSVWHDWRALEKSKLSVTQQNEAKGEIRNTLADEYGEAPLYLVKDPRICRFAPLFLDAVESAGEIVHVVLPVRNPLDVCESLEKRDGMGRSDAALLWLRHVLDAEMATRGRERVILIHSDILADWRTSINKLTEHFDINWPYDIEDIAPDVDAFINPELNHHSHTTEDVLLDPVLRDWVGEAWQALLVLSRNAHSKGAMNKLDEIRKSFNAAAPILYRQQEATLAKGQEQIEKLQGALKESTSQAQNLTTTLATKDGVLAQKEEAEAALRAELETRDTRISELDAHAAETDTQAQNLAADLAARAEEISRIKEALAQKEEAEAQLRAELETRDTRISELDAKTVEADTQAQNLAADLAARAEEIDQLNAAHEAETIQLKEHITQKEGEAGQLAATLAQHSEQSAKLKAALVEAEESAAGLSEILAKREAEADQLKAIASDSQVKTEELADALTHQRRKTTGVKSALTKQKNKVGQLKDALSQAEENAAGLSEILAKREAEADQLKTIASNSQAKIEELKEELTYQSGQTTGVKSALTGQKKKVGELKDALQGNESALKGEQEKINELHDQLAVSQSELRQMQASLSYAKDRNEDLLKSTSWKLTAPIRAVRQGSRAIANLVRVMPTAIQSGGGFIETTNKILGILKKERLSGVKQRIRNITTHGEGKSQKSAPTSINLKKNDVTKYTNLKSSKHLDKSIDTIKIVQQNGLNNILWIINDSDRSTQRYRVYNILDALQNSGIKSTVVRDNILDEVDLNSVSIVVLNRIIWSDSVKNILHKAKEKNIPVIFDVDDLVFDDSMLHLLRAHNTLSKRSAMLYAMDAWKKTMLQCDFVTVSTEALLLKVQQTGSRPYVIPNNIPKSLIDRVVSENSTLSKRNNQIYFGYFSGTKTHSVDFEECADAIIRILDTYEFSSFVLVGEYDGDERFNKYSDRFIRLPLQKYEKMLRLIADMDIVLAPLELNNAFTDCKSQLKVFEAAAFSVPCIASPTRSYLSYVKDGLNGFLASTTDEWESKLSKLIESSQLRQSIGKRAKESIFPSFLSSEAGALAEKTYRHIIREFATRDIARSTEKIARKSIGIQAMKRPAISIVAPLYNKKKEVEYFLDSIYFQDTHETIEVVLVDDLCPQASGVAAKRYIKLLEQTSVHANVQVTIIKNENNLGNCGSRNRGLEVASAPIVMVVDADCIFDHGAIAGHLAAHKNGLCDVAVGLRGIETESDHPLHRLGLMRVDPVRARRSARFQDSIVPNSFVNCVTRNLSFNRIKYPDLNFDDAFSYTKDPKSGFGWEDVEFGYQLHLKGARIKFLKDNISLHVTHEYDLKNPEKPIRSLRNFSRLFVKHPELASVSPAWSRHTFTEITRWLKKFDHPVEKLKDWRAVDAVLTDIPKKFYSIPNRPLRVLTHRWHCAHQFELYRLGHKFDLVRGAGTAMCNGWEWRHRPMPENAQFVNFEEVSADEYDLAIIHFDENILHPERCHGHVPMDWGNTAKTILQFSNKIPTIAICHGTPQFIGQYDMGFRGKTLGNVDEQAREDVVRLFKNVTVICNSHQAKQEWKFKNSHVIWHGFSASDFSYGHGSGGLLAMEEKKMRQRPHYNGLQEYNELTNLISRENLPKPLDMGLIGKRFQENPQDGAEKRFLNYTRKLGGYDIYLNTTIRSPMPRTRGEAMMTGCIPITLDNHDASMFIENGVNGFVSNSIAELADGVEFIMNNSDAREKMRRAARKVALSKFSLDRYLRDWSQVIAEVRK